MRKVKCDFCDEKFNISENSILERKISEEKAIIEKYFTCPKCGHHYYVSITDPEMREAIFKRIMIQQKIKSTQIGARNEKGLKDLMKEDEKLKKYLLQREKELKPMIGEI